MGKISQKDRNALLGNNKISPEQRERILQQATIEDIAKTPVLPSPDYYAQQFLQSESELPSSVATGDIFHEQGTSRYDDGTPFGQVIKEGGIQDWRAQQQSVAAKWGNVAANFGTVATTSFLNNTVGGVWGLTEALLTWDKNKIVDNAVANLVQDAQDAVAEAMPLYRSQAEMELPWWDQLGKANFWGDVVISQGFTAGVIAAMAVTGGVIGGMQRGMQGYRLSRGAFELGTKGQFAPFIRQAAQGGKDFNNLKIATDQLIKAGTNAKSADSYRTILSSIYSSHGYATTEAISHTRQLEQEFKQDYEQTFKQNINAISADLRAQIIRENPMISQQELMSELDRRIDSEYDKGLGHIDELLDRKRNLNYLLNLGYLTATNAAAWGTFARGNYPTMKSIQQSMVRLKDPASIKAGVEAIRLSPYQQISRAGGRIFRNPMIQFAEETSLHINREGTADFYRAQLDPEGTKTFNNWMEAYLEQAWGTISDPKEWESGVRGFIGGLLGGIGPRVRSGKLTGVEGRGGIFEVHSAISEARGYNSQAEQQATMINDILSDDRIRSMHLAAIRSSVINQRKEAALFLNDKFAFENGATDELLNALFLFDDLGLQGEFLELISAGENMNAQEIRQALMQKVDTDGVVLESPVDPLQGIDDSVVERQARETTNDLVSLAKKILAQRNNIESLLVHRGFEQYQGLRNQLLYYMGSIDNMQNRLQKVTGEFTGELSSLPGLMAVLVDAQMNDNKQLASDTNKTINELLKKVSTVDADATNIDSNIQELMSLSYRTAHYKDLYEKLLTEEGAKEFLEEVQTAEQESASKEMSDTKTGADATQNPEEVAEVFKPILEHTFISEKIPNPDNPKETTTKIHKGRMVLTLKDKDGNTREQDLEVQGISPEKYLTLRDTEKGGEVYLDSNMRLLVKNKDGKFVVAKEQPTEIRISESAEQVRQQFHEGIFKHAVAEVRGDLVKKILDNKQQLERIETTFKRVDDAIKRALGNETKTVRPKKGDLLRDDIREYLKVEVGHVIAISQLEALKNRLVELNDTMKSEVQEAQILLAQEYIGFTPESLKEINALIQDEIDNANSIIESSNILIDKLTTRIANLKRAIGARYTYLKNQLTELTKYHQDFEDLDLDDVFEGRKSMSRAHLNTAIDIMSESKAVQDEIQRGIDKMKDNLEKVETELELVQNELANAEKDLISLKDELSTREQYLKEYNKRIKGKFFSPTTTANKKSKDGKALSTQDKESNAIKENEGDSDVEKTYDPAHPFRGHESDFFMTTAAEQVFSGDLASNELIMKYGKENLPKVFESQLKFQRKIDNIDNINNYRLKLVSRTKLLSDEYAGFINDEQKDNLASYEEEGVFVVLYHKDGTIVTEESIFTPGQKLLLLSALHEAAKKDGRWINKRKTSEHVIVAEDSYNRFMKEHNKGTPNFEEHFHNAYDKFDKSVKEAVKESGESSLLKITNVTPGKVVDKEVYSAPTEIFGKDFSGVELVLGTGKAITKGDRAFELADGIAKVFYKNRLHNLRRSFLSTNDINNVVGLFQAHFTEANDALLDAIDNITFLHYEDKAVKDRVGHTLYIETDKTGAPIKVMFGTNNEISKADLFNLNSDKLEEFRKFLETKYYNIKDNALKNTGTFSLLTPAVMLDKDGNIANIETTDTTWDSYNDYLMSGESPRIEVNLPPKSSSIESLHKAPVINRAFKYQVPIVEIKPVDKATGKEIVKEPGVEKPIVQEATDMKTPVSDETKDATKEEVAKKEEEVVSYEEADLDLTDLEKKHQAIHDEQVKADEVNKEQVIKDRESKISGFRKLNTKNIDKALTTPSRNNLSKTTAEREIEILKTIFPNIDALKKNLTVEALMSIKDGKLSVLINPTGVEGRAYHEAFHVIEEVFMTPTELSALYNNSRKRLGATKYTVEGNEVAGKDMTDSQISEFLAEEYREYRLIGRENYQFGQKAGTLRKFFNWLDNVINKLLSFFGIGYAINTKYADMSAAEKLFREWDGIQKNIPEVIDVPNITKNRIGTLTSDESNAVFGHFNYLFFDTFHNDSRFSELTYKELDGEILDQLYDTVLGKIADRMEKVLEQDEHVLFKLQESDAITLVKDHMKLLKQYGVEADMDMGIRDEISDEGTEVPTQFIEAMYVNVKDSATSEVKFLVAGLPNIIRDNDGNPVLASERGLEDNARFATTFGMLHTHLSNLPSYEAMVEKLEKLSTKFPVYGTLLQRLGSESSKLRQHDSDRYENLRIAFYKQFKQAQNAFIQGIWDENGQLYFLNSTEHAAERRIKEQWHNNVLLGESPVFSRKDNTFVFNPSAKVKIGLSTAKLEKFIFYESKQQPLNSFNKYIIVDDAQGRADAYKEFLSLFGIVAPEQYGRTANEEFGDEIALLAETTGLLLKELKTRGKSAKISIEDIFNPDEFKINDKLKELAQDFADYGGDYVNNSFIDKKGRHSFSIMLPSKLTSDLQDLNYHARKKSIPEQLIPFKDGKGNLGTIGAMWLDHFRAGKTVEAEVLRNYGEERAEKEDIKDLTPGDFAVGEINAVFDGRFPFLRSAERGMENMFNFGSPYVRDFYNKHLTSRQSKINMLKNYLKGEVVKALAHKSNPDFKHLTKNEHYQGLSFFENIIPEFHNLVKMHESVAMDQIESTASTLINNNIKLIHDKIGEYIAKETKQLARYLRDLDILKETSSTPEGGRWNLKVLNKAIIGNLSPAKAAQIEKGTLNLERLTPAQVDDLLEAFNLLYLHSALEQSKIFLGDIKQFTKGLTNELFKRTTLYAATKQALSNDTEHIEILNRKNPRIDGTKHGELKKSLPIKDQHETSAYFPFMNRVLKQGFNEDGKLYGDITSNDAGAEYTLDGMHRYMYSAGILTKDKERTLIYGKQFLYQWILNNRDHELLSGFPKKMLNNMFNEKRYNEIFERHLPKDHLKGRMYYEGKEVKYSELSPIEVVKPQTVARIQNDFVLDANAKASEKKATMVLMPMELIDSKGNYKNKFPTLLYATILGADEILPRSTNKNEELGNSEGQLAPLYGDNGATNNLTELFNKEYPVRLTLWSDTGHQLDIDPSGKDRVTLAKQMVKLIPVDMYNNGKIRDEYKNYESQVKRAHEIMREIVTQDLNNLFDELGIEATPDGARKLANNEKFLKTVLKAVESRQQPKAVADSINYLMSQKIKYFETLPTQRQIKNLIQGLIRNQVIKTKVHGDMYVLVSPIGYERKAKDKGPNNTTVTSSEHLKYYRPINVDGQNKATEFSLNDINKMSLKDIKNVAPAQAMISLQKQWIPAILKDLGHSSSKEFTRKVLEDFNVKMLDTSWEHYDKWKKIRTILVNRTPAQHLNSIDVLEVVEFLGIEGGPKVVVPAELLAKTGADFDVDKVTAYLNSVIVGKDGDISISTEGRDGLENELNNIYKQLLLAPENFASLVRPNNPDVVRNAAKEIIKNKKLSTESTNISEMLTFRYNAMIAKNQWQPNKLIGTTAIVMTTHPVLQQFNIGISSDVFESFFAPFQGTTGNYSFGHFKDQKNNIISNTNGDIGTAVVDASKESIPSISTIGYNLRTAYAYHTLNMLGREGVAPAAFQDLTVFFNHDIVQAINKKLENSEAIFNNYGEEKYTQKKNYILRILNKELGLKLTEKHKFLYESMKDLLRAEGDTTVIQAKTNLKNHLDFFKSKNKYITDDLLSSTDPQDQLFVAEYYLYYIETGKLLKMLADITRPDAKLDKNRAGIRVKQERYKTLLELGIFDKAQLDSLMDNSYLGAYENVHNEAYQTFNEFDAIMDMRSTASFMWGEGGFMQPFMDRSLAKSVDDLVAINQKLSNALLSYILHITPHPNPKINRALTTFYKDYNTGIDSVAKQLERIKKKHGDDNPFLKLARGTINELNKRQGKRRNIDYINFNNTKLTVQEFDAVTDGIEDLIAHSDPDFRKLGKSLAVQSLIQSGTQFSPVSFFEYIPVRSYQNRIQNLLYAYKGDPEKGINGFGHTIGISPIEMLTLAKRSVFSNLRDDSSIVPRVNPKSYSRNEGKNLELPRHVQAAQYEYIATEVTRGTKDKPTKEVLLYERMNQPNEEKNTELYRLIPSKGDRFAFFDASSKGITSKDIASPAYRMKPTLKEYVVTDNNKVETEETTPTTTPTDQAQTIVDTSKSWTTLKSQAVYTDEGANTMRTTNKEAEYAHFGNPFSEGGYAGTIKVKGVQEAVHAYKEWLLEPDHVVGFDISLADPIIDPTTGVELKTIKPQQRQWILDQINSGKLDNVNLLYDKSLAARGLGTHAHALAEVIQELRGTQTGQELAQLDTGRRLELSEIEADTKLVNSLQDVWNTLGIKASQVETIKMNGIEIGAVAKANVLTNIIEYVEGKRDIITLPEETSHIVVRMLQGTPIYKAMYAGIVNTDFYGEVVDNYSDIYEGNDLMLREEAMGKAIAEAMVKENRRRLEESKWSAIEKWLRGVLRAVKEMFKDAKTSPYHDAAVRILDNNLTDLIDKAQSKEGQEIMYQNRLDAQDDYAAAMRNQRKVQQELEQYRAKRTNAIMKLLGKPTVDTAEADRAQLAQSEADMLASEERIIESNKTELNKVGTQLKMDFTREETISEQLANFDEGKKYYSNFADKLRSEESRRNFIQDVMDGKIKITC